ncbi:MAG: ABC transporter ATP-binding protein [Gammaproteobacteria bacterium]
MSLPSSSPTSAGPAIEVRHLTTCFGRLRALDDVSISIDRGTITGIIGPNGAGKSTLFNSIVGVTRPSAGEVRFQGQRIEGLSPDAVFKRGLAHTFQIPRPFSEMSVIENLMIAPGGQTGESFFAALSMPGKVARQEAALRERAVEILEFTTLAGVADHPAGQLSGGQLKLLELARVLMGDPQAVLLDEPGAGVNPALTRVLVDKIEALNDLGLTFLVIEHDMDFVMQHCDPIIAMAAGKVIFEGDADAARRDAALLDAYLGPAVDA